MSKEKALDMLVLLSAIESWSFSAKIMLPDYLHENLQSTVESLRNIILEDEKDAKP